MDTFCSKTKRAIDPDKCKKTLNNNSLALLEQNWGLFEFDDKADVSVTIGDDWINFLNNIRIQLTYKFITSGARSAERVLWFNLRPGGGGEVILAPLWFFEDNSKTKGSSVTKLGIPFH